MITTLHSRLLWLAILTPLAIALGETNLAGAIGDRTFEPEGNPYIVNENIVVAHGQSATIKAGCVFLFKAFTGMVVEGDLVADGTFEDPIVFTSIHDDNFSVHASALPNPFDWNGILVKSTASHVRLSDFILAYSVYGIKSEQEHFTIKNGTFKANGQFHMTVKGAIQTVIDGLPFTYNADAEPVDQGTAGVKTGASFARGASAVLGGAGIAAAGACGWLAVRFLESRDRYAQARAASEQELLKSQGQTELALGTVAGGVALAAIPTAIILFSRGGKGNRGGAQTSVVPAAGVNYGGMHVAISF
jgi:hypothetical protein